ncbi:MAG: hypothetical protein IPH88_13315 [Bacteroidales bacterium]|nr:hypothetical protein [Bacteroidales bacterium]
MINKALILTFSLGLLLLGGCYYDNEEALYPGTVCDTVSPSFATTILPIIEKNCASCHSGAALSAGLSLSNYNEVKSAVNNNFLLDRVLQLNGSSVMPPSGPLTNCNLDQINSWISQGMPNN